ncbi:hypothetical protein H0O00_02125 [Candidatus Micrarchaeota archaeon]|nr:hypothetical protein [Candidatus Micrarchaeota archaeon]
MRGQSSLELFVTLGVVISFTIPVILLLLSVSSVGYEDTAKAQADAAARSLADNINTVYAQGKGAQREVLLNVPPSTESISVSGGEVTISIKTSGGTFDASAPTIAKAVTIPKPLEGKAGLFRLIVRAKDKGVVELVDPNAT